MPANADRSRSQALDAVRAIACVNGRCVSCSRYRGAGSLGGLKNVLEGRPQLGPLALPASVGAALTYSAYLWHVDVLRDVEPVGLALIALVAIASAVYVVVERPILLIAGGWVAASGGAASILGVPQSNSTNQATSEIGR